MTRTHDCPRDNIFDTSLFCKVSNSDNIILAEACLFCSAMPASETTTLFLCAKALPVPENDETTPYLTISRRSFEFWTCRKKWQGVPKMGYIRHCCADRVILYGYSNHSESRTLEGKQDIFDEIRKSHFFLPIPFSVFSELTPHFLAPPFFCSTILLQFAMATDTGNR